jgi:hypothetical protein
MQNKSAATTTSAGGAKDLLPVRDHASGSSHDVTVVDALAEVFVRWVVGEPPELILDCLRQVRVLHHRILGLLVRKVGIKVGDVEDRFLSRVSK